jgi:hypothetical protein
MYQHAKFENIQICYQIINYYIQIDLHQVITYHLLIRTHIRTECHLYMSCVQIYTPNTTYNQSYFTVYYLIPNSPTN